MFTEQKHCCSPHSSLSITGILIVSFILVESNGTFPFKNNVIKTLEADAILYSEYEAQARKENEMPPKIPYPKCSIHNDCIQIAHLYTKMFVMINRCLEVCGLNRQKVN